jgi:hypothetical protein
VQGKYHKIFTDEFETLDVMENGDLQRSMFPGKHVSFAV